jgi:hypothetical protein
MSRTARRFCGHAFEVVQRRVEITAADVSEDKVSVGGRKIRCHLQGPSELFDGLVIAPLVRQQHSDQHAIERGRRLEALRDVKLLETFLESALTCQQNSEPLLRRREIRIQLDGVAQCRFATPPVVFVLNLDVAQRCVDFGEVRREFEGALERLDGTRKRVARGQDLEDAEDGIAFGQADVGEGEIRIALDGAFELDDCTEDRCRSFDFDFSRAIAIIEIEAPAPS